MRDRNKVLFLLPLLVVFAFLSYTTSSGAAVRPVPLIPRGEGSLPARLFPNGSVCSVNEKKPSVCQRKLIQIPKKVMKAHSLTFYGLFDLDGDSIPEVFLDYWSPLSNKDNDNVVLLVYKKVRGKYRQYLKLKAESYGYWPGAWFLNDPPYSKAVFMTRYGGSSGGGLFYLNLKKKSLDLISGPVFLEGSPEFLDIDGDGMAEIFMPGRGRDRTSQPGAALLHWKSDGYEMWWPNWNGLPTVVYATLADVDRDGKKEIAAVLEPKTVDFDRYVDGETTAPRELGVWKVTSSNIILLSRTRLPDAKSLSEPTLGHVPPFSSTIELDYVRTVGCTLKDGELACHEEK